MRKQESYYTEKIVTYDFHISYSILYDFDKINVNIKTEILCFNSEDRQ